jgi:hypothetical protein
VHAALGDRDGAFEFLESALRERISSMLWANVDPRLDALRGDGRFTRILEGVNLPRAR